jgi:phosphate transport system protein
LKTHLARDLAELESQLSDLGDLVLQSVQCAIDAISSFDLEKVAQIAQNEKLINTMEISIEQNCLKIIALHQPVATDLRFLIVVLKVNNDLERIADQAVNIGARIHFLYDRPRIPVDLQFEWMGPSSLGMVAKALDALLTKDTLAARAVLEMDSEIDDFNALTYRDLIKAMTENPSITTEAVSYLTISSNVERIADLATNIAEEIIFMNDGEILRHMPMD